MWGFDAGARINSNPVIGLDGTLYVTADDGNLYAINSSGTLEWSYELGNLRTEVFTLPSIGSTPAIGPEGTIYVGSPQNLLHALNADGTLKWTSSYRNTGVYPYSPFVPSPTVSGDGTVYIGSDDGKLYAINSDGNLNWKFNTRGQVGPLVKIYPPAIGPDGTVYYVSGPVYGGETVFSPGTLFAINPDGTMKWGFHAGTLRGGGSQPRSSPVVIDDGTIYMGYQDTFLYAINPNKGLATAYPTVDPLAGPPEGFGSTVYPVKDPIIDADGTAYEGGVQWKYATGNHWHSPVIGADGTVYVGGTNGNLRAINTDGTLRWSYPVNKVPGSLFRSSATIGADGTIYVVSDLWSLHAIDPDGTHKWIFETDNEISFSPVIGAASTIYVASGNILYAIGEAGQ